MLSCSLTACFCISLDKCKIFMNKTSFFLSNVFWYLQSWADESQVMTINSLYYVDWLKLQLIKCTVFKT